MKDHDTNEARLARAILGLPFRTPLAFLCVATIAFTFSLVAQANPGASFQHSASRARSNTPTGATFAETFSRLPLSFEENLGQTDPRVKFLSRGPGYTLFLAGNEAVLSLQQKKAHKAAQPIVGDPSRAVPSKTATTQALRMKLLGANSRADIRGVGELPGKTNYFRGNDPKHWQTNVANYAQVHYENIYPGINLIYYGSHGQLEYDFVVGPGAAPNAIALNFAGARSLRVDPQTGDLLIKAGKSEVRFHKPAAYQTESTNDHSTAHDRHFIDANYVIGAHNRITFQLAPYDHSKKLIVDPALSYSTYLGGSANDYGTSLAVDSTGSVYVVGYTGSTNFPVTPGAFQTTCANACSSGSYDAFVAKLDPSGSTLIYSTYLGGSANDYANGIALDPSDNAYIVGQTFSSDFPITSGAFQTACGGSSCAKGDVFVTELNSTGSALVYSTYLGGSGENQGNAIVLDANNDAYITGNTQSTNFPTMPGAFQTSCSCSTHSAAFVAALNPGGTALIYSTYLGGTSTNVGYALALNSFGDAYVTGYTQSANFPTTPGAFQTTLNANSAGFVTELNPDGSALVYSTYLGGSSTLTKLSCEACSTSIALDSSGDAFVSGLTMESNFPVTPGAYQSTLKSTSQGHNAFITELNPTGTALVFSTYLGGSSDTGSTSIALDQSGNVWVKGNTKATDFPVTPGAPQTTLGGSFDFWVAELNPTGSSLLFSTYLGGSGTEYGGATAMLSLDTSNPPNVYVTGYTNSTNFPVTAGAFRTANAGLNDAVVAKFAPSPNVGFSPTAISFGNQLIGTTSASQTVTLTNTGNLGLNATIAITGTNYTDFAETNTCTNTTVAPQTSCSISVTFTPSLNGAETATVTITDNAPGSSHSLSLSGTGFPGGPAVALSPTSLTFLTTVLKSSSAPQNVTLTNVGTQTLAITSITASGDFSQINTCNSSVAAGANCTISVTFTPTKIKTRTGTLSIADNALGSPQTVSLSGVGTQVQLSPASLNFGTVTVGSASSPQTGTVTNVGSSPLTIQKVSFTGADPQDFSQTNNCTGSLAKGASCTVNVTFKPTATGARTANLAITDPGGGSPQLVPLSGTGQ